MAEPADAGAPHTGAAASVDRGPNADAATSSLHTGANTLDANGPAVATATHLAGAAGADGDTVQPSVHRAAATSHELDDVVSTEAHEAAHDANTETATVAEVTDSVVFQDGNTTPPKDTGPSGKADENGLGVKFATKERTASVERPT